MRFQHVFAALSCLSLSLAGCDCAEGNGDPADFAIDLATLDFGVVVAGAECTREVLLTNGGSEPIRVTSSKVTPDPGVFSIAPGAPISLNAGQQRPLGLIYAPTSAGSTDEGMYTMDFTVGSPTGKKEVALVGYAVTERAPRIDARCEDSAGEAGVYVACPKVVIDNVQQGQVGAARVKLHNLGSEVLHLSRLSIESSSGRWSIERASFEPPNELEQVVPVPSEEGDEPISVRNFVTGDCSLEDSGDPDVPLNVDLSYIARDVGVDEAVLVVQNDDPFKPDFRIPLQGIGNGRKGVVAPRAVVVSGDTSVVTITSLGNTPFPINGLFIDLDLNGEKDEDDLGCRPGERSQEEGAMSCSSPRGSGFQLEAFDGAEGGNDEAAITIYHWGGTAERAQLVLKSNTRSVGSPGGEQGVFIVPIGTASHAQLAVTHEDSLSFEEAEGLYAGSIDLTLANDGEEATTVSGWNILASNGTPVGDDNWLAQASTLTVDGQEVSFPFDVPANGQVVLRLAISGAVQTTWPETVGLVFHHNGVAAVPYDVRFGLALP